MKKLLTLLATTIFATTVSANTIACGHDGEQNSNDLSKLPATINVTLTNTAQTVGDYQLAVVKQLQQTINNLQLSDVNITKSNDTTLQNNDIKPGKLTTKITAKTLKFTKSKIIVVKIAINKLLINLPKTANSIVINNNNLYTANWDDRIYRFDLTNNQPPATAIINLQTTANSIIINGDAIYAATQDKFIYKYDIKQNKITKTINLQSLVINTIAINDNYLYAGSEDNHIYEIDINAAKPLPTNRYWLALTSS